MRWVEKEVTSLELSKKLKELGFPQSKEGWYWVENKATKKARIEFWDDKFEQYLEENMEYINLYKAFTNSELGEWLPIVIKDYGLSIYKTLNGWAIEYEKINFIEGSRKTFVKIRSDNETEANTRAKTVIWLRENGYILSTKETVDLKFLRTLPK